MNAYTYMVQYLTLKPAYSFFLNKIYNTCTEEWVLAAHVPNPMGFYFTWKESLWNKLSYGIKIVLVYRKTHLIRNNEVGVLFHQYYKRVTTVTGGHFDIFLYHLNWTHKRSKMALSISWQELVWPSYGHFSNQL